MHKLITGSLLGFTLLVTGCGSKGGIDEIVKLKDEACACTDKACAEAVNKKLDDAVAKMALSGEPDEATGKKLMEAMTKSGECLAKHMKE